MSSILNRLRRGRRPRAPGNPGAPLSQQNPQGQVSTAPSASTSQQPQNMPSNARTNQPPAGGGVQAPIQANTPMNPQSLESSEPPYTRIHFCVVLWQNYDFAYMDKPEIHQLRVWFQQRFPGKFFSTDLLIPSTQYYGPEDYLVQGLQEFYAGVAADAVRSKEKPLAIVIYSGHASPGPLSANNIANAPNLKYVPHDATATNSLVPRGQQQLFFIDSQPSEQAPAFPSAILDFNRVHARVTRPLSVTTWFILSACHAGHAFSSDLAVQRWDARNPFSDEGDVADTPEQRARTQAELARLSQMGAQLTAQSIKDTNAGKLGPGNRAKEGLVHYWCEVGPDQSSKARTVNFFSVIRQALDMTVTPAPGGPRRTGATRRFGPPGSFRINDVWRQIPYGGAQEGQDGGVNQTAQTDFQSLIGLGEDDGPLKLPFYLTFPVGWNDTSLVQPTRRFNNVGGAAGVNPAAAPPPPAGEDWFAGLNLGS